MNEGKSTRTAGLPRSILDSLTILLFLAAIAAPTIDLELRPDSARSPELVELRTPALKPTPPDTAIALAQYPVQYEAYFKDSFGLRDQLLRWNSIIKVFGFGVSPSSEVFFGKDGWLFYTGEHSRENHRGAYPFNPVELAQWARTLERKRALLEAMGIPYLYVIAPDKETVYSELLPDYMRPIGPTRLDQFLEYMKENAPKVEILNLSDSLKAAKRKDGPGEWVYGDLGTHWTGRGSQVALRALLVRLRQMTGRFEPEELDSFQRVEFDTNGDSWTTRMYIGDLLPQSTDAYKPPEVKATVKFEGNFGVGRIRKSVIENSTRPRVLLMHDSFGPHIEQGLAEQCSYLECRWDVSLNAVDIESAAPDVFVDLYVERILNHLDPKKLLPGKEFPWAARFMKSKETLVGLDTTREDWGVAVVGDAQVGPAVTGPRPRLPIVIRLPSARLALPSLTPIEGSMPVAHISIDSPFATQLILFYRAPGAPNFLLRTSYKKALQPGNNDFYLPLDHEGTSGELVLMPGDRAGTYLLRDFEIRSVKAP